VITGQLTLRKKKHLKTWLMDLSTMKLSPEHQDLKRADRAMSFPKKVGTLGRKLGARIEREWKASSQEEKK
jgi:hypothetical protein